VLNCYWAFVPETPTPTTSPTASPTADPTPPPTNATAEELAQVTLETGLTRALDRSQVAAADIDKDGRLSAAEVASFQAILQLDAVGGVEAVAKLSDQLVSLQGPAVTAASVATTAVALTAGTKAQLRQQFLGLGFSSSQADALSESADADNSGTVSDDEVNAFLVLLAQVGASNDAAAPSAEGSSGSDDQESNTGVIVGVILGVLLFFGVVAAAGYFAFGGGGGGSGAGATTLQTRSPSIRFNNSYEGGGSGGGSNI